MKKYKIVISHSKYKGYEAKLLELWFIIPIFNQPIWIEINVARGKVATLAYYITRWVSEYKVESHMIIDTTGENIY